MSPSPLVGYNTNVRHHGKVFHIQTEDSGVSHGHIHTHLFADGGRIVATRKTSYRQHLGTPRFPAVVKSLMKAQHKAMFIALRDGLFDEDEAAGAREFALREIHTEEDGAPTPDAAKSAPIDVEALDRAAASFERAAPGLDAANFEAAAATYEGGGFGDVLTPIPEPTAHGITSPGLESPAGMSSSPGTTRSSATFPRPDPSAPSRPSSPSPGRYAVTAPVASRQPAKETPHKPKDSLFGHDLLSEKSLDEVILSYLADDLDEKK